MKISMDEVREFAKCPLKYKFTYIDKYGEPPDRDKELYDSVKTVVTWFFDKIRMGQVPGKREMRLKWGKLWYKDKDKYDILFDTSYKYEKRRNFKGVKIIDRFYDLFIKNPGIILINDFDFDVPIGDGHILTGRFDLVREIERKNRKLIQLINWRTDRYVPYNELRSRDLYLVAQDYAFRKMFEQLPDELVYYAFLGTKMKKVSPMRKRDFERLASSINNIASIIKKDLYFPRLDEHHNMCRHCQYTNVCWNWR